MTKKPPTPMNPVIPSSMKDMFLYIELTHQLSPGKQLEGCTGKKSTCPRKTAPLCKACLKL